MMLPWAPVLAVFAGAYPYIVRFVRPHASVDLTAIGMGLVWLAQLAVVIARLDVFTDRVGQWLALGLSGAFVFGFGFMMLFVGSDDECDGTVGSWFAALRAEQQRRLAGRDR